MKIAHLCHDEKFINFIAGAFEEVLPGGNDFIIFSKSASKLTYTSVPAKHVLDAKALKKKAKSIGKELQDYDLVIIHFLSRQAAYLAKEIPETVPLMWSGWGADYLSIIWPDISHFYLPLTKKFMQEHERKKNFFRKAASSLYRKLVLEFYYGLKAEKLFTNLIPRFQYFSAPIHEDYLLVKEKLPALKARWQQINYTSFDETQKPPAGKPGLNILLGNSASATNNHEEAMEILSKFDLTGRKVIVPLSYGPPFIRASMLRKGEQYLGESFYPLTTFMEFSEYNQLISSASIGVMNHMRQEGLGNILAMLYDGSKVFLNEESPVYQMFQKKGACIFSTRQLQEKGEAALKPLPRAEAQKNRKIILKDWGRKAVLGNLQNLVKTVSSGRGLP